LPKKTKLITVPEKNEGYRGTDFKRWDLMITRFLQDHPDRKDSPPANSKQKRKKK